MLGAAKGPAVAACVRAAALSGAAIADIDYVTYKATYHKVPGQPLPAGVATYGVFAEAGSGITDEEIVVHGLERANDEADLCLCVLACPPRLAAAELDSFRGQAAISTGGQRMRPFFDYTI